MAPAQDVVAESQAIKDRLKASYDAIAPIYNAWTVRHSALRLAQLDRLVAAVPALTQPGAQPRIFELGCGAGEPVLRELAARVPGARIVGNDLSSTQLALAREALASERVSFVQGDMTRLDVPDASQDAVVALYSLVHLPAGEQADMLAAVARWLRPGGGLLANFSGDASEGDIDEAWLDSRGWMFWSGLGRGETLKRIGDVGLEVVWSAMEGDEEEQHLWVLAKKPLGSV